MYKLVTIVFLLNLCLCAATPELFRPIGDPVYQEIDSVEKMAKMDYFAAQKQTFQGFIDKANLHKKLGLLYDNKHQNNTLSTQEQKSYLAQLRALNKELKEINLIAKAALENIIKKDQETAFYQLKDTGISVLQLDTSSAVSIKKYADTLSKRKQASVQKKVKEKKAEELAYYKTLRTPKNLDGKWKSNESEEQTVTALFEYDRLSLTYTQDKSSNLLKGRYVMLDNMTLEFHIEQREYIQDEISHLRQLKLTRIYEVEGLSQTEIILKHKDELLRLKRF